MLFRKKHIELILAGRKTQTRRLPGKSANYHVGRVYSIRDVWFRKAQGHILITRKFRQRLGEISPEDFRKEGYSSLEEFHEAWKEINGYWNPNEIVTCYEFTPVKNQPSTRLDAGNGAAQIEGQKQTKNQKIGVEMVKTIRQTKIKIEPTQPEAWCQRCRRCRIFEVHLPIFGRKHTCALSKNMVVCLKTPTSMTPSTPLITSTIGLDKFKHEKVMENA